jgi:hypothetical protein
VGQIAIFHTFQHGISQFDVEYVVMSFYVLTILRYSILFRLNNWIRIFICSTSVDFTCGAWSHVMIQLNKWIPIFICPTSICRFHTRISTPIFNASAPHMQCSVALFNLESLRKTILRVCLFKIFNTLFFEEHLISAGRKPKHIFAIFNWFDVKWYFYFNHVKHI